MSQIASPSMSMCQAALFSVCFSMEKTNSLDMGPGQEATEAAKKKLWKNHESQQTENRSRPMRPLKIDIDSYTHSADKPKKNDEKAKGKQHRVRGAAVSSDVEEISFRFTLVEVEVKKAQK
jgi:hypothetical protein